MAAIVAPNIVTDGLVACWDAGNRRSYPGAGTTWTDLGGSSNGSFVNIAPTSLTFDSAHGGSIVFDGTDDYVLATDFQDVNPVSGTNSYTFGIWVYFNSVEATTFLSQYISASNRWSFWVNAADDIYFADRGSGGDVQSTGYGYTFTTTQWYYLTVLKDGSTLKIYIDGSLADSESFNPNNPARSAGLLFGTDTDNYDTLDGKIALVHAYNKALTDAEVSQNYEAMKPRFEPKITKSGLVGNWDAGDPQSYVGGTTWKDIANTNNGTLTNDVVFSSSNGGYFQFDGTDAYVNMGSYLPTVGTVSFWFTSDNTTGPICYCGPDTFSSNLWDWGAWYSSGNGLRWVAQGTGGGAGSTVTTTISNDVWYHFALVRDEDGTNARGYLNGASTGTSAKGTTNANYFRVAKSSTYELDGNMALIRLYDRALSAAEILDNYNKTKGRFGH